MPDNINRSETLPENFLLYRLYKAEELDSLSDDEFEILQGKLKYYTSSPSSTTNYFKEFFEGYMGESIQGDGNKVDYAVFKRKSIIDDMSRYYCFYRYERIFTFLRTLGVKNIYDIGCGQELQALLLVYEPDMNYTGIDSRIFENPFENFVSPPEYINEIMERFIGNGRIRFIRETYPCELTVARNNIALLLNVLGTADGENPILKTVYKSFERIIVNIPNTKVNPAVKQMSAKEFVYGDIDGIIDPFEEQYKIYKEQMPDYTFYHLGNGTIFGTSVSSDREKIENGYIVSGDEIATKVLDRHFIHR